MTTVLYTITRYSLTASDISLNLFTRKPNSNCPGK